MEFFFPCIPKNICLTYFSFFSLSDIFVSHLEEKVVDSFFRIFYGLQMTIANEFPIITIISNASKQHENSGEVIIFLKTD